MTVFEKFGMFITMLMTSIWNMIPFLIVYSGTIIWTDALNKILGSNLDSAHKLW